MDKKEEVSKSSGKLIRKIVLSKNLLKQPVILVIGDIMLDIYITGAVNRLSPEAPVPIVNVQDNSSRLGGAGNVVENLLSLSADVIISGIVGNDENGNKILSILTQRNLKQIDIQKIKNRPTTTKTRVVVGSHQLLRYDYEFTDDICRELEEDLFISSQDLILEADLVVLSDYNKGLLTETYTQRLISFCNQNNKKVIVDPKGDNFRKYRGAYIIKPNKKELMLALKLQQIYSESDLQNAVYAMQRLTKVKKLIITLSEDGIALFSGRKKWLFPVKATEVFDVTGAGDTVLATLAYFISIGFSVEDSCEIANYAAALVVRQIGSTSVSVEQILKEMRCDA